MNLIEERNLPKLLRKLINKLLLLSNINFISLENILYDPYSDEVHLNTISIVGVVPLLHKKYFGY